MADIHYCKNCGTKVELGVNFCSKCGTHLVPTQETMDFAKKVSISEKSLSAESNKIYSKKSIAVAIAIPIAFVVILFLLSGRGEESGSAEDINPEQLVTKIEDSMDLKFFLDPLGKVADENIEKWYGASHNGNGISLLFYSDSDALARSTSLKDYLGSSSGSGGYCGTFAYFGDQYLDVEKVYNVLIQNYPECKPSELSSTSETSDGENYSSDSVAGSGITPDQSNSFPECQKLANTVQGGLKLDPYGGNHWGIQTGKPGYCILPNSGGEKYYYSGE